MPDAGSGRACLAESGGRWKLSLGGNAHVPLFLPARPGSYWNIRHISRSGPACQSGNTSARYVCTALQLHVWGGTWYRYRSKVSWVLRSCNRLRTTVGVCSLSSATQGIEVPRFFSDDTAPPTVRRPDLLTSFPLLFCSIHLHRSHEKSCTFLKLRVCIILFVGLKFGERDHKRTKRNETQGQVSSFKFQLYVYSQTHKGTDWLETKKLSIFPQWPGTRNRWHRHTIRYYIWLSDHNGVPTRHN